MERCLLFPKPWQNPVCKAGSDISGVRMEDYICSDEYSENCLWFREWEESYYKEKEDGLR